MKLTTGRLDARHILVVGTGSIGTRHARLALEAGHRVTTVSRRGVGDFSDTRSAIAQNSYDLVIIATETRRHRTDLMCALDAGFSGPVLVEKPLFDSPVQVAPQGVVVGYNLRWHPAVRALRDRLNGDDPTIVSMTVGQDLRNWRPGRHSALTASATAGSGGVLRDLSHELDMCTWLFGAWTGVVARVAVDPTLGIEAESRAALLIETERGVLVSVTLDYYASPAVRTWTVSSPGRSITLDLVRGDLAGESYRQSWRVNRDLTYRRQLELLLREPQHPDLCSAQQGANVVALISAAEQSMADERWIRS